MKTYLYTDIIRISNDLMEYSYKNIKDIRKTTKLLQFPIFLYNEDLARAYKNNKSSNSNNWSYKIIAHKLCPFILEFQITYEDSIPVDSVVIYKPEFRK